MIANDEYFNIPPGKLSPEGCFMTEKEYDSLVKSMVPKSPIVKDCIKAFLIGGLIMCLTLNVNFGYVMLCSIPLQALIVIMMVWRGNPLFAAVQKKIDRVNSVVQENITGARVIKAYTREEYEMERFDEANKDYRNTNLHVMHINKNARFHYDSIS